MHLIRTFLVAATFGAMSCVASDVLAADQAIAVQQGASSPGVRLVPKTSVELMGYAIGVELADKFKKEKFKFDVDMASQGLRDAMSDQIQLKPAELTKILDGFQAEFRRQMTRNHVDALTFNHERNDTFFVANKSAEGVQVLPSGVQYRVIKAGSGRRPNDASTVMANFVVTLLDGSTFQRSEFGEPAKLKVPNLPLGWRVALSAMPLGSHWQIWIPSSLAYGDRGNSTIGPAEPLVIDLEVLDIKP